MMSFTSKQISNFLDDKILFRFTINSNNTINFNEREAMFTFDQIEKVIKTNFDYWKIVSEKAPSNYYSNWQIMNNKINGIRKFLSEIDDLNTDTINNYLYYNLSSSRETTEQGKLVYILSIDSPIDKDLEIRKIKSFVSFYIEQTTDNLTEAIRSYIYLSKNTSSIGNYFSSSYPYQFYPALYLLRKQFSNIRENIFDFEKNIIYPLTSKLQEISDNSNEQYKEITSFIENRYNDIQQQFDDKAIELKEFQSSINRWQKEKKDKLEHLEETYKNKLSLEAPEQLWNKRATEYIKQARNWTIILIVTVLALIFTSTKLITVIHNYSLDIIKEIPFLSESFVFISVISFFIYIIRILVKIVMSNHHLATEYKQKAALTRFYQSLTYAGTNIDKEERLIIINSLFSRIDTGLIKVDNTNDNEVILAILSKNIK